MKKLLLTGLMVASTLFALAQAKKDSLSPSLQGNNEIKLNILYTILGSPEITYERILSDHNAIGISAEFRLFEAVVSDFEYGFTPYFRRYFGVKKASGFFLEGHAAVFRYDGGGDTKQDYNVPGYGTFNVTYLANKETFFGLGAAFGTKFLTRKGFTGEFSLGAALPFGNKVADFMPRIGLILGKRF
jgi:hypothetical protein